MCMKKVLIINSHELLRDFIKQKLSLDQVEVIVSQKNRDDYTKLISNYPNLVLLDMVEDETNLSFLEKKMVDPNLSGIPIILTGPAASKAKIASFAKYGVIKYFQKPYKFDVFYNSVSNVLKTALSMDITSCYFDIHHNGNIIFIEFSSDLNQEKLGILQYKLSDMIERDAIDSPKIIIMLSGMELSFVDGYNIEFLINNILLCPKVHGKNIKILSKSPFLRELVDGHPQYAGIQITDNLPSIITSLIDIGFNMSPQDLIIDRIITTTYYTDKENSDVQNRFFIDNHDKKELTSIEDGTVINVAIVDSDTQNLVLTRTVFESIHANIQTYTNGTDFFVDYQPKKFDLIILDIMLSDSLGFDILQKLGRQNGSPPIIVYSQSLQKDIVVKVLSSGARSYLVKPQKPNVLLQKCLNLLQA